MHDSTSMKTIATMTMAFLPATFIAALFAIPSLQWDKPSVIGSRFWVYWAFTIPTTILVFVIWFGMRYKVQLWEKLKKRNKSVEKKWQGEKTKADRWDTIA
jgi:phosphatidylglycerophosphate synthase